MYCCVLDHREDQRKHSTQSGLQRQQHASKNVQYNPVKSSPVRTVSCLSFRLSSIFLNWISLFALQMLNCYLAKGAVTHKKNVCVF